MKFSEKVKPLIERDVHSYGSHFAVSRLKYELIDLLASRYPRPLLHKESVQTLQILAQLLASTHQVRSNTPRQIEQRKLASQLRQLTGCIGNLRNLQSAHTWNFYIERACADLMFAESMLRQQMATIKERIPA